MSRMGRDECSKKLARISFIISDVKIDVSLMLPLVNDFYQDIIKTLQGIVKQGVDAERILAKLKE